MNTVRYAVRLRELIDRRFENPPELLRIRLPLGVRVR
jgi:superfamily II DNA or RNA helicase